ncbi:SLEI domain protein, PF07620 family [Leptospira noguchii str. 2006001870]|nr:SLEI domain protein, PF07620 family [Leptospira noguchii str. 2006001870]
MKNSAILQQKILILKNVGTTTFRKTPNHKTLLDSELFSELVPKSQRSLRDHSLEIFNKMQ